MAADRAHRESAADDLSERREVGRRRRARTGSRPSAEPEGDDLVEDQERAVAVRQPASAGKERRVAADHALAEDRLEEQRGDPLALAPTSRARARRGR